MGCPQSLKSRRCAITSWSATPEQRQQLHAIVLHAYRDWAALARLLLYRLDRNLSAIVSDGRGMDEVVFEVIGAAERDGWLRELVAQMREDRPDDPELRSWTLAAPPAEQAGSQGSPDRARRVAGVMSFDLDELRGLVQLALDVADDGVEPASAVYTDPTFESVEIRGRTATFSARFPSSYRRIILRVEGDNSGQEAGRQQFIYQAGRAREASSHPRITRLLTSGYTRSGYPFVTQLIDQETTTNVRPLPVEKVIDIGAKLADAVSYAHSVGATFGIIEPSDILLTADDDPVLSFPSLPMFAEPVHGGTTHEARDVHGLCAALFSMLPEYRPAGGQGSTPLVALDTQARELLLFGMQPESQLRPTAAVLHDRLNTLKRNSAGALDDISMSARFTVRARGNSDSTDIVITGGDLFAEQSDIVVAFSDTFDTATEDAVVITSSSIQGQLIDRVYQGSVAALDRDLAQALSAKPVSATERRSEKTRGKLKRYRIGTVAVLEPAGDGRRIFAVAVSHMDNNFIARSSYGFLQASLTGLWAEIRRNGGRPVAMPIIGAGLSRVDVSLDPLLQEIITSFSRETQAQPVCSELRIIVLPSDLTSVDILAAASSVRGLRA